AAGARVMLVAGETKLGRAHRARVDVDRRLDGEPAPGPTARHHAQRAALAVGAPRAPPVGDHAAPTLEDHPELEAALALAGGAGRLETAPRPVGVVGELEPPEVNAAELVAPLAGLAIVALGGSAVGRDAEADLEE